MNAYRKDHDQLNKRCYRGSGLAVAVMFTLLVVVTSACGKRPPYVDPPADTTDTLFPRTYPDLSTDPSP